MSEDLFRSFSPELEVKPGGDGRTIYGIVVPWNAPARVEDDLIEQWASGAFNHQIGEGRARHVRLEREHVPLGGTLIGAGQLMRNDPAGLYMELRASRTPVGDETLELVRDGALDQMSIQFRPRQNRMLGHGRVERVKADLRAVAIVMEGAYGEKAAVAGMRSRQIPLAAETLDLRAQAEEYLRGGLPKLPDHELQMRALRLGMPL